MKNRRGSITKWQWGLLGGAATGCAVVGLVFTDAHWLMWVGIVLVWSFGFWLGRR